MNRPVSGITGTMVSVICIFFNAERYIAEAVDSVLAQEGADFEVLLVDDGSTDASGAIARGYAARLPGRVRYLHHPDHANRGMSAARNLGLRHARGAFIAFIDGDDRWRPGKLAEQLAIFAAQPDAAMVCGTVNYWGSWEGRADRLIPTGHTLDRLSRPPGALLALYPLGSMDAPSPSDIMVRRAIAESVGGFEEEFTGLYEDVVFFAKVFAGAPAWFSSRVWVDYRQHRDSSSASVVPQRYLAVRRRFLAWLAEYVANGAIVSKRRVMRAIALAEWELDHPRTARWLRRVRKAYWALRG